jgi:hypothetical protein
MLYLALADSTRYNVQHETEQADVMMRYTL